MLPARSSLKLSGCETGRNRARVVIARFRTAGRECESRGVKTARGLGSRLGSERYVGNRVMRMDRMDRVSKSVSGDMEDWLWRQYIMALERLFCHLR